MARQSFALFGWSWTGVSVLGSQVFGRASMESCEMTLCLKYKFVCGSIHTACLHKRNCEEKLFFASMFL